jgi:Flp pilus assembly pilin Flp
MVGYVSKNTNKERGVATVEYGITLGAVALVAAVMFAQTSGGIKGIWQHAAAATAKSPAAASGTTSSIGCMADAHGDSKACSNTGF